MSTLVSATPAVAVHCVLSVTMIASPVAYP